MNKNKGGRPTTSPQLRTKVINYRLTNDVSEENKRRLDMMKKKGNGIKTYDDLFIYMQELTKDKFL